MLLILLIVLLLIVLGGGFRREASLVIGCGSAWRTTRAYNRAAARVAGGITAVCSLNNCGAYSAN
jgi:hypothetical protein